MLVKQVLNNNVVSAVDEDGLEIILTGRGLGFNTRAGDSIERNAIDKIFRLEDSLISARFKDLVSEVPVDILQITADIISHARTMLTHKLSEGLYVTLADHLHFALQRQKNNEILPNLLEWEVRHFYKAEYAIGRQGLGIIVARTGILLPESEACSIALHVVNAGLNDAMGKTTQITRLIYQLQNIVKIFFNLSLDEHTLNYQRFITHLKFFAQRVIDGVVLNNDDEEFFALAQRRYQLTLKCVDAIDEFVRKNYHHPMSNSEKLYLTVHIENIVQHSTPDAVT
ncbi:BglG family transcription antiterminator LicT [Scandinavium goeteborgense]|uniref:BglG family transcription antiterminator LicT n=1 Tax=Scandinavium goeteborgense TaxID=1851514 RepID=UPI000F68B610|nr:PRD domain-containing protein [Scandinavium goeteborgense]QKN81896.1 PRD domain-containing protein [Scandinavium goeteborgense]